MTPTPPPAVSPWQWRFADYAGRVVTLNVYFNTSTRAIINPGMDGNREAGCLANEVQFGWEPNIKRFPIPEGNFSVSRTQLANQGFNTIDDVLNGNVTLGMV
jgi:hypothetical protein